MWDWIRDHLFSTTVFICFALTAAYALWLRHRMASSKSAFALAVVAALCSTAAALLTFLSGPVPLHGINAVLPHIESLFGIDSTGTPTAAVTPGWLSMLVALICTVFVMSYIYKLANVTLINWDGPITLTVNELAKREQDNNLLLLAFVEAQRLIASKPDPLASDLAINWQQKQSEAPTAPAWHILARDLFQAAFSEADIPETGWRDHFHGWVGEVYLATLSQTKTAPLLLLVVEREPSDRDLKSQIDLLVSNEGLSVETRIFVAFYSGDQTIPRRVTISQFKLELWSRSALLRAGLKLTGYARDLVRRFEKDTLGGTTATLSDTFVEAHVIGRNCEQRQPLLRILSEWLLDKSRRQLAITGEYGQGKSTAMLEFCTQWAKRYLETGAANERVPLLIELRGQNPAEVDPIAFLSPWAGRYGLQAKQVYNLIRAGEATVIFEGFDELRNAGRSYDRHEHFNALWRMAFPGTKIIFTGRPNFFIDQKEKNRTLRTDELQGAGGNAFTQLWELDRLTKDEVAKVASGFGPALGQSIVSAAATNLPFFEIISRPSMLPVVATIWKTIEKLKHEGYSLTSAVLLEPYLQAIYRRKEEEIERDRQIHGAPVGASYLLLPREVREVITLAIIWRMADFDARNTISRSSFNAVIAQIYEEVLAIFQRHGVPTDIIHAVRAFEERFRDETPADRLERVSNEIATAGLFVPDPAGGPSNLRLPHKQFYEYMIAKVAWITLAHKNTLTSKTFRSIERKKDPFEKLLAEDLSLHFFSEIIGSDFKSFRGMYIETYLQTSIIAMRLSHLSRRLLTLFGKIGTVKAPIYKNDIDRPDGLVAPFIALRVMTGLFAVIASLTILFVFFEGHTYGYLFRSSIIATLATVFLMANFVLLRLSSSFPSGYSFPRLAALRRMVSTSLKTMPEFSNGELPLLLLHQECLALLCKPSSSKIKQAKAASAASGSQEWQNLISPIV